VNFFNEFLKAGTFHAWRHLGLHFCLIFTEIKMVNTARTAVDIVLSELPNNALLEEAYKRGIFEEAAVGSIDRNRDDDVAAVPDTSRQQVNKWPLNEESYDVRLAI
jgi:hypothetical protein